MVAMSGLTKKTVLADRTLSALLGVNEGELVSYAQLSKGLHKYIKDNDLRNPERQQSRLSVPQAASLTMSPLAPVMAPQPTAGVSARLKSCRDCASEIPAEAVFCDLCGVRQ